MTKRSTRLLSILMLCTLVITMILGSVITVSASQSSAQAYSKLVETVEKGIYTCKATGKNYNFSSKQYKSSGGGYELYVTLSARSSSDTDFINESALNKLTASAKQEFLKDMISIANAMAYDTEMGNASGQGVTTETVNDMLTVIQAKSGMGSSLLATLLSETKPDYATANRIYQPFSGVVGTILGVLSIVIMSLLGVTMGLDIAYITIPAFQLALGGADEHGGGDGKGSKGLAGIISQEAKAAIRAASGGQGGQGGGDDFKSAVGIYFKYRWKGLVLLGICLLYLVQGQIYTFVGWFIDLFSGFLGF